MSKSTNRNLHYRLHRQSIVGCVCLLGILIGSFALLTIAQVNGPIYRRIAEKKDLLADILPPPIFIVEAYLIAEQSAFRHQHHSYWTTLDRTVNVDIQRLETAYHNYRRLVFKWKEHLSANDPIRPYLESADASAMLFWDACNELFIPALQNGDFDRAEDVAIRYLTPAFKRHRIAIDKMSRLAVQQSTDIEQSTRSTVDLVRLGLVLLVAGTGALILYVNRRTSRTISRQVGDLLAWVESNRPGSYRSVDFSGDHELQVLANAFSRLTKAVELRDHELTSTINALSQKETDLLVQALELESALTKSRAANDAKTQFLTNMSHEFRTPLNAIIGFSELIDPTPENEVQLDTLRNNARHLMSLLNGILDLAKIEAGQIALEFGEVDLGKLVRETAGMLTSTAQARSNRIEVVLPAELPVIKADAMRVRQVLLNLIGNAIKFTQHGIVTVAARATSEQIFIEVIDTGIGISTDSLAKLFKPFQQADASITRKFGGTGMGLSIVAGLARAMGGDVRCIRSAPGCGSTFEFSFRAEMTDSPISSRSVDAPMPSVAGMSLLVVDDMPDNLKLLKFMLRKANADATEACDGQQAIDAVRSAHQAGKPFDAVLLDMQMPVMDGYSAAAIIHREFPSLPIIALTAHAMTDDRQHCLQAGCCDYLTKPVDRRQLLASIRDRVGDRSARRIAA
jgi:signal transduction histidine kinase/CheY-like chemotaxis protein